MIDRTAAMRLADAWWAGARGNQSAALAQLVLELADILTTEPFDAKAAARAGATLVDLRLTDPLVIPAAAAALAGLPALLPPGRRPACASRLPLLIGALGQGFAAALQRHTAALARRAVLDATAAARQSETRFRALFDNTAAVIFVGDPEGRFTDANPALAVLLGQTADELRGGCACSFLHPDDRREIAHTVYHQLIVPGRGRLRLELRLRRGDGSYAWIAGSISLVPASGAARPCLIGFGEDVTEQRKLRDELYWQARHDPLTALPNRLLLRERLDAAIATSGPGGRIGMCFLDLDGFKAVNDRHGHSVGDRLLTAVAGRLREAVAGNDIMIARLGGDEFVALLNPPALLSPPALDRASFEQRVVELSQALLAAVQRPVEIAGRTLRVSASIGALATKIGDLDADALLDSADAGLYRAKANTRQRIAFTLNPTRESPALSR
jgi:diguanylate cyclase (GGDEF)-like protein/PAS domain S-box-containing protein